MTPDYKLGKDLPTDQLPFSERKQHAVVGHALMDGRFCTQLKDRISASHFAEPFDQILWTSILEFWKTYDRCPRAEEIRESPSVVPQDPETKERLRQRLDTCLADAAVIGKDVLEGELTAWMQAVGFQRMFERAHGIYTQNNLAGAIEVVRKETREIEELRFVQDTELRPEDYGRIFEKRAAEMEDACTFGSSVVDRVLNPEAKSGSLLPRSSTLLVGGVNSGKTRCMVTITRHNAFRGKNILYMMHEGDGEDVYSLLYTSLISRPADNILITPQQLRDQLYTSPAGKILIEQAREIWNDRICFLPMIRPGLTVEEVVATVRRKQDQWAAKHGGRGFDLIVDDYPALLQTQMGKGGQLARREKDHLVYLQLNQLATELDAHGLFAIQGNREANKAMKGRSDKTHKRLLTKEDIEEAYGPAETCATVITLNRDDRMARSGHVVFYKDKGRTGQAGIAVVCRSAYGSCITHDEAFGATWYWGTASHAEQLENMLQQFPGVQVSDQAIISASAA